ncbi:MAG: chromosome partitioning protein [Planctomycetaceae bacterium TMED240]|nr:chromosome partitioning protein [Rhodopirellula sp.]OUX08098.1 MAG: chromosome partitioning protein [Planctomycetaceae bacterium TMED240]
MTQILAVIQSDALEVELNAAVSALGEQTTLNTCPDLASSVSHLRHEAPDLLIVELSEGSDQVREWQHAIEVHDIACPIIGILDDDPEGTDELLVEAVRVGFRDFLRRPASAGELAGVIRRIDKAKPEVGNRGRLLAVVSTKGGVGKSTIAINTAVHAAATTNQRVLLVDASLQLGVSASLLNLTPTITIADLASMQERLDATMLREVTTQHESGLHVLPAPPTPAEASEIDDTCMSIILGVAKSAYDLVIVDSFPLLDATTLAILDRADHVCVVTENVVPTLTGTAAMLKTLDQLDVGTSNRTLVLNRHQRCAGSLSASEVEQQMGEPAAAVIKHDRRVLEAANLGRPIILSRSKLGVARAMRTMANGLLAKVSAGAPHTTQADSQTLVQPENDHAPLSEDQPFTQTAAE